MFLGAVPEEKLPLIEGAAQNVRMQPFTLVLDRIEHWSKTGVLCATASAAPAAAPEAAAVLWEALVPLGFTPEIRPYRPHVTLARKVLRPRAVGEMHPVTWNVERFSLVESETLAEGSRYTVLNHWPA